MSEKLCEQPVILRGPLHEPMLGMLHTPPPGSVNSGTGVVIVNGGAQYRAGAHRLFVQLARHLARQGHAVLRFDFPGQGDSPGNSVGFENTAEHIRSAIDTLQKHSPALERTALLGLCDGASASLLYLHTRPDARVTHLALLNPWVHSEQSEARAQIRHYYRQRLLMPDFWRKLFRGGVGWSAAREWKQKWHQSRSDYNPGHAQNFQTRMAEAWRVFSGRMLLVLSESDQTAQEFKGLNPHNGPWTGWLMHSALRVKELALADHTFSTDAAKTELQEQVSNWLNP